jgi:hypothetical protein
MRVVLALLIVACSSPEKHEPVKWALAVIAKTARPCSVSDSPCEITWRAEWFGEVETRTRPNGNDYSDPARVKPSTSSSKQLSRADLEALTTLVTSSAFHDGMTQGFACQGPSHDPQVTLQLVFVDPVGVTTSQFVEKCTRGPDAASTLPSQILRFVR